MLITRGVLKIHVESLIKWGKRGLEEESATDLEEKEPNEERYVYKVCKPLPSP